jgi:hypothetical protein
MISVSRHALRVLTVGVLTTAFVLPADLLAQAHVVSPADLQKQLVATSQARQHNVQTLKQFFATRSAEKALKSARIDPVKVQMAIATLDNAELAELASRAEKAQADFAAGRLSDRDLLIILIGVAALILIIVAVN